MANAIGNISNGVWTAAGNWSTGAAPTSSDNAIVESGTVDVSSGYPTATTGVNYIRFVVRENFIGKIATAISPFYIGTVANPLYYAGLNCQAFLAIDVGDTSSIDVLHTKMMLDALVLSGEGTWADVSVHRANRVTIATGATVTNLRALGQTANIDVNAGATVTNMSIDRGVVSTKSIPATRADVGSGGVLEFSSTASITAPLVTLASGGLLRLSCGALTITALHVYPGATIAWSGNLLGANTITNLYIYGEGNNVQLPPNVTVTNTYYRPIRNV